MCMPLLLQHWFLRVNHRPPLAFAAAAAAAAAAPVAADSVAAAFAYGNAEAASYAAFAFR